MSAEPACHLCHATSASRALVTIAWVQQREGRPPRPMHEQRVVALCTRHVAMLAAAGERGRLHGPTGVRYWLGARQV